MWVVEIDLVEDWLRSVDEETYDLIVAALAILKEQGPGLGRPLVDYDAHLEELKKQQEQATKTKPPAKTRRKKGGN